MYGRLDAAGEAKIEEMLLEKSALSSSLTAERDRNAALQHALDACKRELREQLLSSQADLANLDQALADKDAIERRAHADALEWKMKLDKSRADLANTRSELAEALAAGERLGGAAAGMRTRLVDADLNKAELESVQEALRDALTDKVALQSNLEICRSNIASLEEALAATKLGTAEAKRREDEVLTRLQERDATVTTLMDSLSHKDDLIAKLSSKDNQLQQKMHELEAQEQRAMATTHDLQLQIRALEEELGQAKAVVEEQHAAVLAGEAALAQKDGEIAEKVAAVSAALQLQLDVALKSLAETKQAQARQEAEAEESGVAHRALQLELTAVRDEVSALQTVVQQTQEERDTARQERTDAKEQLLLVQGALVEVQGKQAKAEALAVSLREELSVVTDSERLKHAALLDEYEANRLEKELVEQTCGELRERVATLMAGREDQERAHSHALDEQQRLLQICQHESEELQKRHVEEQAQWRSAEAASAAEEQRLLRQLQVAEHLLSESQQQHQKIGDKADALEREHGDATSQLALERARVADLEASLLAAHERERGLQSERTALHERWEGLQRHVEAAIVERKELKEALEQKETAVQQQQRTLAEAHALVEAQTATRDAQSLSLEDAERRLLAAQEEVTRLTDTLAAHTETAQAFEAQTSKTEEAFLKQIQRAHDERDAAMTERDAAMLERNAAREDADLQAVAAERAMLDVKEAQEASSVLAAQKLKLDDEHKATLSELYEKAAEVSQLEGEVGKLRGEVRQMQEARDAALQQLGTEREREIEGKKVRDKALAEVQRECELLRTERQREQELVGEREREREQEREAERVRVREMERALEDARAECARLTEEVEGEKEAQRERARERDLAKASEKAQIADAYAQTQTSSNDLRYVSSSRSLLPYNRSLLTLTHTSGVLEYP